MNCLTDHFYKIGASHTRCEDYAISGSVSALINSQPIHYAICCDGCSSSPGDVTVGARLLAHTVKEVLPELSRHHNDFIQEKLMFNIRQGIINGLSEYGLSLDDFLCTVQLVFVMDGMIHHFRFGDGIHATKSTTGVVTYTEFEFASNAPFYPVYSVFNTKEYSKQLYDGCFGSHPIYHKQNSIVLSDGVGSDFFMNSFYYSEPVEYNKMILVGSDGLKSFSLSGQEFTVLDVMDEVMDVKSYTPGFIQRRMNKFLHKAGISHYDDVSVASIVIME